MADNVPITPGSGKDIATDDVASVHYQKIKVDLGGDGVSSPLVRGQQTKANSIPVTHASDDTVAIATGSKVQLTDGTSDATVRNLAANDALNVAIVDGSGAQITSFAGTGGTSATDGASYTQNTTPGTPVMGVYEASPTTVVDGDLSMVAIDASHRIRVSVDASALDVNSDAVDSGAPVKIGGQARSSFPTAVANADRVNAIFDLLGRQLIAHIAPEQAVHKNKTYTSQQTGSTIWDPTAGKKIAVTSVVIGTYGTTSGRIIVWLGDNADTSFSQDVDQVIVAASFAPSTTSKPGLVYTPASPVFCTTADREIHVTSDAGISFDLTIEGYEF
jgi:hypothetical protein